ncbi:MAG: hypothetical protein HC848_11330 [Limnobacter sp.]|nr:hypothetical protein [Limnobacter sp.]
MNSRTPQNTQASRLSKALLEVRWLALFFLSIYLLLILSTYSPADDSFTHYAGTTTVYNFGGRVGAVLSNFLFFLSGWCAYALPALCVWLLWRTRKKEELVELPGFTEPEPRWVPWVRPVGFLTLWIGLMGLENLSILSGSSLPAGSGGTLGSMLAAGLTQLFGLTGAVLFLLFFAAGGLSGFLGLSWVAMAEHTGYWAERTWLATFSAIDTYRDRRAGKQVAQERVVNVEKTEANWMNTSPFV